jgi:Tfp pilus assembly protein PilO
MSGVRASRIFREKRTPILLLLVLAAGNALVYATVVYPAQRRVASADQRAAAAAAALAGAEREQKIARETVEGKERAEVELRRFYEEILPADQSAARRMTYLRLAEVAGESNLAFDHRTFTVEDERGSALRRLDITMLLQGSYADIRQFLHELEKSPEFVVISQIELQQRAQQQREPPGLDLRIQLATYYRVEPQDGR